MLAELPAGTLDQWLAYRELEPEPIERLTQVVKLAGTAICRAMGMQIEPEDLDPKPKEAGPAANAAQTKLIISSALGPPA